MNKHFGEWYRLADIKPEHDTLVKRSEAIESLVEEADVPFIIDLSKIFYGLTKQGSTFDQLRDAMLNVDNAFQIEGNLLEMRLLAGACLNEIATETRLCVEASFLVASPSLLGKRNSIIIKMIPNLALKVLLSESSKLRTEQSSKWLGFQRIDEELEKISAAEAAPQNAIKPIRTVADKLINEVRSIKSHVKQLEKHQELFREDSDILWWMNGRYSRDLDKPLSELNFPAASIILGKELADLVRVQPGPLAARAALSRCLEPIAKSKKKSIPIADAVNNLPKSWKEEHFENTGQFDALPLCPLTSAIHQSNIINEAWTGAAEAHSGVSSDMKMDALDLAYQMYLETLSLKATAE